MFAPVEKREAMTVLSGPRRSLVCSARTGPVGGRADGLRGDSPPFLLERPPAAASSIGEQRAGRSDYALGLREYRLLQCGLVGDESVGRAHP